MTRLARQLGAVAVAAVLSLPVAAVAQDAAQQPVATTAPALTTGAAREIRRPAMSPGEGAAAPAAGGGVYEVVRVAGSLALVLVVIVGLKVGAAKLLGLKGAGPNANKGVRVLSRTLMGPKQQLVLLQVGRKLVLVGDSAGTLATVTEITDPDEVAELAAQALGPDKAGSAFGGVLKRDMEKFDERFEDGEELGLDEERRAALSSDVAAGRGDASPALSGLAERVRRLGNQFSGGGAGGREVG